MGVAVSSSHVSSAAPSSSGEGLLTLFPCSSVGSLPRGSALHELLQRESFARAAVLHKVLQPGLSHEVTAAFGPSHLLRCGVLHGLQGNLCSSTGSFVGCRGISAPPLTLPGLQGGSLPSRHGLQGNLCSGAPPPSPLSLTSGSAELFLSHPTPLSAAGLFFSSLLSPS